MRQPVVALLAVLALAVTGCGGDDADEPTAGTEIGDELTHDEFTVEEGWRLQEKERTVGIDETVQSPEITGEVTNNGDEAAFALFEIVFAAGDEPVAIVKCSSQEIEPGETGDLLCPGLGQPVPEGFDQIVTRDITRE